MRQVEDLVQGTVIDEISLKGINRPIKIYPNLVNPVSESTNPEPNRHGLATAGPPSSFP